MSLVFKKNNFYCILFLFADTNMEREEKNLLEMKNIVHFTE